MYKNKPFISDFIFIRAAALPLSFLQGCFLTVFLGKPLISFLLFIAGTFLLFFDEELNIAKQSSNYIKKLIAIYGITNITALVIGWLELYLIFGLLLVINYIWAVYSYKCYKQLYNESNISQL